MTIKDHSSAKRRQAGGLFLGSVLLLLGAWFLFDRLAFDMPGMAKMWPMFPFFFGLAILISFFARSSRSPGTVWPGTYALLVGSFFFLFSFQILDWSALGELWPVFPLFIGIAFVATWVAGRFKEPALLVPGSIAAATGVLGLFFTLGDVSFEHVKMLGSLSLVAFGLLIVVRSFNGRESLSTLTE